MRLRLAVVCCALIVLMPTSVLARLAATAGPCLLAHSAYMPGVVGSAAGPEEPLARGAAGKEQVDFNGDGCADLAVGAPYSDVLGTDGAGYVQVFYGSHDGLAGEGQTVRPPIPMQDGRFGDEIAAGDFNNDGYTDLAVGAPGQLVSGEPAAGAVYIFPGTPQGIDPDTWTEWHQDTPGVPGGAEAGDRFGSVMAVGDFEDDGFQDLALGIPDEWIGNQEDAGFVIVMRGSTEGITSFASQEWRGREAAGDRFGFALAAGQFGGGPEDDLAVSSPGWDDRLAVGAPFNYAVDAGEVRVLPGSPNGLVGTRVWLNQSSNDTPGASEDGDEFGYSLAAGDFDNNGVDDLAVGVPKEDVLFQNNAGRVVVFYGVIPPPYGAEVQQWYQGKDDIPFNNEAYDWFGASLGIGDFNNDNYEDLLVGVPLEDVNSNDDAGSVAVLYGGKDGLSGANAQGWDSIRPDKPDEKLGARVTAGDYNGDGYWDMATGVHRWRDGDGKLRGYVLVLQGSQSRLTASGYRELFPPAPSAAYDTQYFGWTVR